MMNKPQALLTKLLIPAVVASIATLGMQPSYSLEALPWQVQDKLGAESGTLQVAEVHNNRGVDLAEKGKVSEAIAAFNQAIEIYPKYENAHNNLGLALSRQQQFSQAADAFKQAIAINPKNFETYNNLGIALGSQGKFSEAISAFKQALQIKPDDPTSHQNLGVAFWSQGKLPEAVTSLQKARDLYVRQDNTEGMYYVEHILQHVESQKPNDLWLDWTISANL